MILVFRALGQLFKNWKSLAAMSGLILATGFSGKLFLSGLADSIRSLWWVLALACLIYLAKEYMANYFDLKKNKLYFKDRE